jgi:hypothetical protein
MDQLLTETKNYMNLVTNKLESINNSYNYGIVQLLSENRTQTKGKIKPTNYEVELYGKPEFETLVNKAFTEVINDIDSGNNTIIKKLKDISKNEHTPVPLVIENMKKYITDLKSEYSNGIAVIVQEIVLGQETYVQIFRKLNVVGEKLDGKILDTGKPRMYRISGLPILPPEVRTDGVVITDSFDQFKTDYDRISKVINNCDICFNGLLFTAKVAFNLSYKDGNFEVVETNLFSNKSEKLFFMIMGRIISDKNKKKEFIDSIIKDEQLKTWKTPVNLSNKFENIVNDLDRDYSKELKKEEKIFKDLKKNKNFKDLIDGIETKMYKRGKPRKFSYTTTEDLTSEESKILNLYNNQSGNLSF